MTERNLDFDRIINRKNTDCLKYDFAVKRGMPADVLPLWVADMDFETSSYIEDALVERAKMGIYGYSDTQTPYFEAVAGWMKRHHNWEPKEEWLIKTPGVVFALAMAVKAYTAPGDAVLLLIVEVDDKSTHNCNCKNNTPFGCIDPVCKDGTTHKTNNYSYNHC